MMMVIAVLAAVLLYLYLTRKKKKKSADVVRDSTPALDARLREALEIELAEGILGTKHSSVAERKPLTRTLANEPDADVVGKIEDLVKAVELEFVRYAHESDTEVTVRVRYENGKVGTTTRRLNTSDVPPAVLADFKSKGSTRVFRTWAFPWQRVQAL